MKSYNEKGWKSIQHDCHVDHFAVAAAVAGVSLKTLYNTLYLMPFRALLHTWLIDLSLMVFLFTVFSQKFLHFWSRRQAWAIATNTLLGVWSLALDRRSVNISCHKVRWKINCDRWGILVMDRY